MRPVRIDVDFDGAIGSIKPMHCINNAPLALGGDKLFSYLGEAGIPYSRMHDIGGNYGGACFVDIANVFPDFNADPADPQSYDFAFTDWLFASLHKQGVKPFYRLGATIENQHRIKAYRIYPPADSMQWAHICAGIIRHYNEGWAEGFRYGIEYWEIWNEPDNEPAIADNPMWKGTKEQFFAFYKTTSNFLKAEFPHLKIGGYGSCGFYALEGGAEVKAANSSARTGYFIEFFEDFLDFVSSDENKCPLDFFSWHSYDGLERNVQYAGYVRRMLDARGLAATENILNEWNPCPSIALRPTEEAASRVAAMMCALQRSSVDMLMYYDAQLINVYGGLFDSMQERPLPALYVFRIFNELYRLGTEVAAASDSADVLTIAATDGRTGAVELVNTSGHEIEIMMHMAGGIAHNGGFRSMDVAGRCAWSGPLTYSEGAIALKLGPHAVCCVSTGRC